MPVAADCAIDGEVLHGAADIAKEALIIGGAVVDIEAADGLAVAVKGAAVWAAVAADWGPGNGLSVYIFSADLAEVDIVGEDGVGGRFVVVDELGKFPQLHCAADLVLAIYWLQLSALTTL